MDCNKLNNEDPQRKSSSECPFIQKGETKTAGSPSPPLSPSPTCQVNRRWLPCSQAPAGLEDEFRDKVLSVAFPASRNSRVKNRVSVQQMEGGGHEKYLESGERKCKDGC